jgi:hypothetical protein
VGIEHMSRLCWWLVDLVSSGLESDECDAVRGDFTESGETAGQALWQILGLVVRRQAALWRKWRPWVGLLVFSLPLGILFGVASRIFAYHNAIYLWLYTNYWSPTILEDAAYRHDFLQYIFGTLLGFGLLAGSAASSGFALGFASRRSLPVNGVLFSLLLFLGGLPVTAPRHSVNSVVYEHAFYRVLYPVLMQTFLVLAPSLWGMRQGLRLINRHKENHT